MFDGESVRWEIEASRLISDAKWRVAELAWPLVDKVFGLLNGGMGRGCCTYPQIASGNR